MTQSVLRRNLTLFLLFFLTLHFIAHFSGWYRSPTFSWVDIPIHFLAGVWVAAVFYWFFQRFPSHFDTSRHFWITLSMVLGWVALIGTFWEFAEYSYDLVVAKYNLNLDVLQFGLRDTLGDLLSNLTGALALAIFVKLRYHR
jgi:hypothetical protein